jgi:hypothetical protein
MLPGKDGGQLQEQTVTLLLWLLYINIPHTAGLTNPQLHPLCGVCHWPLTDWLAPMQCRQDLPPLHPHGDEAPPGAGL